MAEHLIQGIVQSLIFSLVGVLVLGACFWVITRMVPFSVRKEIEEDQNTALAIVLGAVIIGLSIIVATAIR